MKKKAIRDYVDPEKGLEAKERGNTAFRDGNFPEAAKEYEEATKVGLHTSEIIDTFFCLWFLTSK